MYFQSVIGIGFENVFVIYMENDIVLGSLLQESDQNQEQVSDGHLLTQTDPTSDTEWYECLRFCGHVFSIM